MVWLIGMAAVIPLTLTAGTSSQAEEAEPRKTLTIYPAAEPDPPLKYRFWPAPQDRTSDNPSPFVSRAIILQLNSMNTVERGREYSEKYERWSQMPLSELPRDEVRAFVEKYGGASLRELARAENFFDVDYDLHMEQLTAAEMVSTLLPELQQMRELGRLLYLRVRLAVAEKRWQDAAEDLRVGFRLSEVAAHSTDFIIGRLVGFAIAGLLMEATQEAIQQPDCPNFYWALACIPADHLFETRDSIESESAIISRLTGDAEPLPDHPIGAQAARDRIRQLAEQAVSTMSMAVNQSPAFGSGEFATRLLSGAYVVAMADESREMLASSTSWGEQAYQLSAAEAVLRASLLKFERTRDRWVKWNYLPGELWPEYRDERDKAVQVGGPHDVLGSLVNLLTPAVDAARRAGLRAVQQRNFVLSIEALRMHAAQHGELPTDIDGLRPVPCWPDPLTGEPFGYQRTSPRTATLTRGERFPDDKESLFEIELMKGTQ